MKNNVGTADRLIRIIVAVAIAALYFTNIVSGTLGIVLLAIAGVFLVTGLVKFCPLYFMFGIRTNNKSE